MAETVDCDVLIVGAGPTGVGLAVLLAQAGVGVIIVDRAAEIYPLPRAAHIDHEALRILQAMGVADSVAAASQPAGVYDFRNRDGQTLLRFDSDTATSPSGWPMSNMIHQPSVERILRQRLSDLPAAALRQSHEFTGLDQDANGVTARFDTPHGPQALRARWLVGADGAASPVRASVGAGLSDYQFDEPWLVVDVLVHDASRLPTINLQICDPERPTTCVLMAPGRHRWEFMLRPGETAEQVSDPAFIADLLRPWNVEGAVSIERSAVYRFHALVAERWRSGRVLLAGDAAHQMPPFAGQGLCSGLRDAVNLGWKLADVVQGGDVGLLDSYQAEREPHVRAIIDMALMMGRTVCILDLAAAAARDAAMLAARAAGQGNPPAMAWPAFARGHILAGTPGAGELFPQPWQHGKRLDDALGDGAWLISRTPVAVTAGVRGLDLAHPDLAGFSTGIATWLDRRGADAVLVRPDRVVFGTGAPDALLAAYTG